MATSPDPRTRDPCCTTRSWCRDHRKRPLRVADAVRAKERRRDRRRHDSGALDRRIWIMRQHLSRRTFLRGIGQGTGVAIALPLLEAMIPTSLIGSAEAAARVAQVTRRNRLLLLYYPNGVHTPNWYPTIQGIETVVPVRPRQPGTPAGAEDAAAAATTPAAPPTPIAPYVSADYPISPALRPLERHRNDF